MLLKKIHDFYEYRGLSLKSLCKEYDQLQEGRISETQVLLITWLIDFDYVDVIIDKYYIDDDYVYWYGL